MTRKLAGCVLLDKNGHVGLLHRNKLGFVHWELPGGKVEVGETDEDAAQRELQEELGVKVKIIKCLGSAKFSDGHGKFDYVWFKADIIAGEPTIKEPESFDDFQFFAIKELNKLVLSGNMKKLFPLLMSKQIIL